ncbi:sphingosine-1-phosphate phosphatase 2 [Patagioenas fasciata monilis]|uniref:Sphingosine-1-phosphate phosphatase 2 n=1 Tax=Patagioenas fasciata monilis TaxID=372326 RepID=A0A1V4K3V9_PATFA|nr:sphingosine-1-phosphate phosphatase 2 [Patagioenas fasciata monilis]
MVKKRDRTKRKSFKEPNTEYFSWPSKAWTQKYIVKNYFYYYLFKFSAALGEEIFYITFLPFIYWNIDHSVSRRMIIVWSIVMYIGQVSKDILKWPRPLSPPVVKLEMRTDAEYGMPSTHAMAATAISFSFVIATVNQYKYPFELGLAAALVFSTLVCLSRLYTGMHTVLLNKSVCISALLALLLDQEHSHVSKRDITIKDLLEMQGAGLTKPLNVISLQDVIGGALISAVLLVLLYPAWDAIDHLLLTSPFCPLISIVLPLVLCYNYPKLDYYSPTRGDTTTILGAGAGATVGFWLNNQYAVPAYTSDNFQFGFHLITSKTVVLVLARFFVGICVVLLTRQLMKSVALGMLGYRYNFSIGDLEARRQLEVEVPYKFITYSSVGFSATVLVPLLHELLGLM